MDRGYSRKLDGVFRIFATLKRNQTVTPRLWLTGLIVLAALTASSQVSPSATDIKSPELNVILETLEDIQHRDPTQSRPYELTREYRVFHGLNKESTSEVMAQINFVPPDIMKTYKIIQASGQSRGEKMVRELLDRETESAKKGRSSEISRTNYDFVFLRRENFGGVPEYVLGTPRKGRTKTFYAGRSG